MMRIVKGPYILLIISLLICTLLLLLSYNTNYIADNLINNEDFSILNKVRFSSGKNPQINPDANHKPDIRNLADIGKRSQDNGQTVAQLSSEKMQAQVAKNHTEAEEDKLKRADKIQYHKGHILVKFSPKEIEQINQGKKPNIHGKLGRMISKGGFYEVFPDRNETVEDLLEKFNSESSQTNRYVQLDYECEMLTLTDLESKVVNEAPQAIRNLMWHLDAMNIEGAWQQTKGNESIIIAILDTGIAFEDYPVPSHESQTVTSNLYIASPSLLSAEFWENQSETQTEDGKDTDNNGYVDDRHGYDFVNKDGHPNDNNGHGTHLASIVAQNSTENEDLSGIAPDCTIMSLKVLNYQGKGFSSNVAEAIYYAVDQGADVLNLSLAWPPNLDPGPILWDAIAYAASAGVIIIAGAGNNAASTICYPAAYDEVLSVGGIQYDQTRAYYSNYGHGLDIVAPGGNTWEDQNFDGYSDGILQVTFDSRYRFAVEGETLVDPASFTQVFIQGTSMATAEVSGVVGLMLSVRPDLSLANIRSIFKNYAKDLGPAGWDKEYGYGLIDAGAFVTAAVSGVYDEDPNAPPDDGSTENNTDFDGDGFVSITNGGNDCNDYDPNVNPGAVEIPYDGIDQDCSGSDLADLDQDNYDALEAGGSDCNDQDPTIHPGALDIENDGIDQNCDGIDSTGGSEILDPNVTSCDGMEWEMECDNCSREEEIEAECP